MPVKSDAEMNQILLQSIQNSKLKGYHGDVKDMNKLPEPKLMLDNWNAL